MQEGQKDEGVITDCFRGILYIQTLEKLPMIVPKTKRKK